ncbi:MAG: hypothetical protein ACKO96_11755, partial [Flammeovirgaceae bacterium]
KFYTEGRYGNNEFKGRYVISDSTVFLNPDTDWQTFDGVIKPRLRIMNNECLREAPNPFTYAPILFAYAPILLIGGRTLNTHALITKQVGRFPNRPACFLN